LDVGPVGGEDAATGEWGSTYHVPVLADSVAEYLRGAGRVLDGTLGGGGHAAALLAHGALVDAIDRDPEAVAVARARLAEEVQQGRLRAFVGNFAQVDDVPALAGVRYAGVLLDLGVSSRQVDDPGRGFSFRVGVPLDMRMGGEAGTAAPSAADWLNTQPVRVITEALRSYGDEPHAARLAREIVRRRARAPFATSDDLVDAIRGALGPRSGPPQFARLFQAIRIAVNGELDALEAALPSLRARLLPGGRMVVIAYHSGEDRVVKQAFRSWSKDCICPPRQPACTCGGQAFGEVVTRRPVAPTAEEVRRNPRARSAKLRVWQRNP
jgi:16S rRNA (cytosine1402-N4)-methyltransferase